MQEIVLKAMRVRSTLRGHILENQMEDKSDMEYFGNDSATFGDRVYAARETVGLSQDELAKRLGVKRKTMRAWEEDLAEPRANKLQMLAGVLNVSVMWLLTGEGDGVSAPAGENEIPADAAGILADLRTTRLEFKRLSDKVARLERRMAKLVDDA